MPSPDNQPRFARRLLLVSGAALGLATVAGCESGPPPAPDPLEPLRAQAQALAALYTAAMAADPALVDRLTSVRDAHLAHVAELTRLIGRPAGSATPASTPGSAGLRAAEEAAAKDAVAACLAAPTERAAVVGSIAAARATHLEVLA